MVCSRFDCHEQSKESALTRDAGGSNGISGRSVAGRVASHLAIASLKNEYNPPIHDKVTI